MCHHVHAADQRNLYLALLQTNDHSTVPGPVIAPSLLPIAARSAADQSHNARDQAIQFQAAKLRREFARNSEQQKILLGAPPTSQIEEGVSVHNECLFVSSGSCVGLVMDRFPSFPRRFIVAVAPRPSRSFVLASLRALHLDLRLVAWLDWQQPGKGVGLGAAGCWPGS